MDGHERCFRATFQNPQHALYDRVAAVRALAGELPVEGRVLFTRRGKFPKGLPRWTLMVDSLRPNFRRLIPRRRSTGWSAIARTGRQLRQPLLQARCGSGRGFFAEVFDERF